MSPLVNQISKELVALTGGQSPSEQTIVQIIEYVLVAVTKAHLPSDPNMLTKELARLIYDETSELIGILADVTVDLYKAQVITITAISKLGNKSIAQIRPLQ